MAEGDRRTFASYKTQVIHSLGNPDTTDMDITAGDIVNDALEHIAAMHQWQWLLTGEKALDVVADQDYVELPADFGGLIAIEHNTSWTNQMVPVTWQYLLMARQHPVTAWNGGYFYVINMGNVELGSEDAGLSLPTLNLYPTPATSSTGAIKIVYRRFLRRLVDDDDRPQWPAYMDRPLSLLARAFAQVDYNDDPASAYTDQFIRMIDDCKANDGLSTDSYGTPIGAIYEPHRVTPWGYPSNGIPDPTN